MRTVAGTEAGGIRATKVTPGDLLTQVQRKTPVVQIILNNESLHFVNIEMQEAGVVPFGVDFKNPNFAKTRTDTRNSAPLLMNWLTLHRSASRRSGKKSNARRAARHL